MLGKQAFFEKAYDHTLSFSKQVCADLKRAKQKAERAQKICQQSQPIKNTLADFTLAAHAYSHGFEVFIMQAPKGADFNNVLFSEKREL